MKFTRSSIGFGSEPFESRRMGREPVQHKNLPIEIRDCFPRFHPHFRHAGRHVSKENPLRECAFPPFCEAHDRLTKTHNRSLHCRFSLEQLRAHAVSSARLADNRKKDSSPRARARRNHIATARSTPTRATPRDPRRASSAFRPHPRPPGDFPVVPEPRLARGSCLGTRLNPRRAERRCSIGSPSVSNTPRDARAEPIAARAAFDRPRKPRNRRPERVPELARPEVRPALALSARWRGVNRRRRWPARGTRDRGFFTRDAPGARTRARVARPRARRVFARRIVASVVPRGFARSRVPRYPLIGVTREVVSRRNTPAIRHPNFAFISGCQDRRLTLPPKKIALRNRERALTIALPPPPRAPPLPQTTSPRVRDADPLPSDPPLRAHLRPERRRGDRARGGCGPSRSREKGCGSAPRRPHPGVEARGG